MSMLPPLEHLTLPGDGVTLHAVAAGPANGPLVVLLHGFPEFWYGWRHQLGPLAAAGFRVVAPDQRGYARSDKPPHVRDYTIDRLARDVVAVLDALGAERAAVVGHDWGGGVAWWLGLHHPERLGCLAVLNCPHPTAMRAALEGDVGQLVRSWYMFAMQVPGFPELPAKWTDYAVLTRGLRRSSRPGTFTAADVAEYRRAWAEPGALTGMVNWYRAAFRRPPVPGSPRVRVPTLLLWGDRDAFLRPHLADSSINLCDRGRLVRFPRATHWLQHEEPAEVTRRLIEFVRMNAEPEA